MAISDFPEQRYAKAHGVTSDVIDGEAVIVNLVTGAYYSLVDSGASIWSGLLESRSVDEIAAGLNLAHAVAGNDVRQMVARLVGELREEALIVPVAGAAHSAAPRWVPAGGPELRPPVLAKFTDMEELLTLDPIHETDPAGWPARR